MHLVVIFGPPAVGKMTVGMELSRLTGYRLFHNHMSVEPIKDVFDYGTPSFGRLVGEIRRRVVEEAVVADLPGLVMTFVWGLDLEEDARFMEQLLEAVAGHPVDFVELAATFEERKRRNVTELRREHKRSHRDAELSDRVLHELEREVLNGDAEGLPEPAASVVRGHRHVRIDNTDLGPGQVARRVVAVWARGDAVG